MKNIFLIILINSYNPQQSFSHFIKGKQSMYMESLTNLNILKSTQKLMCIIIYLAIFSTILFLSYFNAHAQGVSKGAVLNVADFYSSASTTSGIQEAIDALHPEGGLITIPPGTYLLKRSIVLRDNITLRGSGPATILKKCQEVQTRLTVNGPKGNMRITVEHAEGFEPGMQICVKSKEWVGWHCSQPFITGIIGTTLLLSDSLEKDYSIETTVVINYFPGIWILSKKNILIEDITIDGNIENNGGTFQDFVTAAIHSGHSDNLTIRGCRVRNWPSDGIGIQGGSDIFVTECNVSGCRGQGFHPGTLIQHAVFSNLVAHHNAGDGLYFCAFVKHINVSNSIFYQNGKNGIGGLGGEPWPDCHNVVANNICEANGMCGIQGTEGSNFVISNNICRNNSQSSPGAFPGILLRNCANMLVNGNLCYDDQEVAKKTQKCGIEEIGKSINNLLLSNNSWGNIASDVMESEK